MTGDHNAIANAIAQGKDFYVTGMNDADRLGTFLQYELDEIIASGAPLSYYFQEPVDLL